MESECDPNVIDEHVAGRTGISILDLNQDCLLQVFGHLGVYDAINFGETCKLLHTVLRLALTKYKNFVLLEYPAHTISPKIVRTIWNSFIPTIPPEKVLSYVAPHIELLDARTESVERRSNMTVRYSPSVLLEKAKRLQIFLQIDMPKIKSLIVENSGHLAYITSRENIKELTIYDLNTNDLNNFASGMRNLTQLHLYKISRHVAMQEISGIVENNPHIEDLCLIESSFENPPREIPVNIIRKLPHLKQLELSIGSSEEILEYILQMQQLTKLALLNKNLISDGNGLNMFLRKLAKTNTVRALELKDYDGDVFIHNRLFDTLASMNLISLRIDPCGYTNLFFVDFTRANFHTLKNLRVDAVPEIEEIMLMIDSIKSLERLVLPSLIEPCNSKKISRRISRFLKDASTTTRPDMELKTVMDRAHVKISFRRGNFDIISWPEPYKTTSMVSEWGRLL